MIKYLLLITFLDTGANVSYPFDNEANCKAVIPAVQQLYDGLRQPVELVCKPRDVQPAKPAKRLTPTSFKF